MSLRPRQLAQLAKNGTEPDVTRLILSIPTLPPSSYPDVLDAFCAHFRKPNPGAPDEADSKLNALITACFAGMYEIVSSFAKDKKLAAMALRHWDDIFRWMRYLHEHRAKKERRKRDAELFAGHFLGMNPCGEAFHKIVRSDDRIFEFIAHLWWEESIPGSAISFASTAFTVCFYLNGKKHTEVLDRLFPDADVIANLALSRLQKALSAMPFNLDSIFAYIGVIDIFSIPETGDKRRAILNKQGVRVILHSLKELRNESIQNFVGHSRFQAAGGCFDYIHQVLLLDMGVKWVTQALSFGLLKELVLYSPHFASFIRTDSPKILLEKEIPPYLILYSVLNPTVNSMKNVSSAQIQNLAKSSEIGLRTWDIFEEIIMERAASLVLFNNTATPVSCCNATCSVSGPRRIFQKCANCKVSIYCSKTCQVIAWKERGHRKECPTIARHNIDRDAAKRRNEKFVQTTAVRDVRRHIPALRTLATKNIPAYRSRVSASQSHTPRRGLRSTCTHTRKSRASAIQSRDENLHTIATNMHQSMSTGNENANLLLVSYPGDHSSFSSSSCMDTANFGANLSMHCSWPSRLRADAVPGRVRKRPGGTGPDGRTLETTFDEIDEIIYQVKKHASSAQAAGSSQRAVPWNFSMFKTALDQIAIEGWPFEWRPMT
ncbi:hypothetical protein DFH11DRAFT_1612863 [Phellopilus nigrolimitatus]|nr:hypothetical protein DFH11DRAFT_1612863 [Phellopilus nigrolimitatus]